MQVVELLAKESALMRERQLLAKEVEFLRHQMTTNDKEHGEEKLYSPHKVTILLTLVSSTQFIPLILPTSVAYTTNI